MINIFYNILINSFFLFLLYLKKNSMAILLVTVMLINEKKLIYFYSIYIYKINF